jgi:hypothetical protein
LDLFLLGMGQKKKQPQAQAKITFELSRMVVPVDILAYFEMVEVKELTNEWQVVLHEKESLIPALLKGIDDIVLDGYCNPLQVLSHCFTLKPVYLVMKRRRWKQGGTNKHYSNEYELTNDPSKLTKDMAGFLKI